MKKILEKILDILLKITKALLFMAIGAFITYFVLSIHISLDKRESPEYANLLRCEQERYDYCPYCGKELTYTYHNPLSEEETQRIINEWSSN